VTKRSRLVLNYPLVILAMRRTLGYPVFSGQLRQKRKFVLLAQMAFSELDGRWSSAIDQEFVESAVRLRGRRVAERPGMGEKQ